MQNRAPAAAYLGYVFEDTGYGAAARGYVRALHGAGVDFSVANLGFPQPPHFVDPIITAHLNRTLQPDFYLWHSEPQDMLRLGGPLSQVIAITTWEADLLPDDQLATLNRMAEVWVPSRFNLESFRAQLKTPVFQLPHPVAQPAAPRFDRAELNQELGFRESDFVFVSVGSWQERKNLHGVVEAFLRAFPEEDDAILVLKTGFHFSPEAAARAEILHAINRANPRDREAAAARIRLFPMPWPAECLASLALRADCFVSLHRGEGWGYPLFDAVCQGTPVVATGYSGPMDYLDPEVHRLVDYRLVPPDTRLASVAQFPFHRGMRWAEPDIHHASLLMREIYENRVDARERAQAYAGRVREKYSVEAVGKRAAARLASLAANMHVNHSSATEAEASVSMPLPPSTGAMLTTPCRV